MRNDDPDRPRKPRPEKQEPTVRETVDVLAAAGNISELVKCLGTGWQSDFLDGNEKMTVLNEALTANANKGTTALIDALFNAMLQHDAGLLLRCQLIIGSKTKDSDRQMGGLPGPSPVSVVNDDLPRLLAIEDRLIHLAQTYARFRHVMGLSEGTAEERKTTNNVIPLREVEDESRERAVCQ